MPSPGPPKNSRLATIPHFFEIKYCIVIKRAILFRSPSLGARATAGGESPTMADLSSNNTPETSQRSKKMGNRRLKSKKVEDQPKFRRELTPTGTLSIFIELERMASQACKAEEYAHSK